MHLILSLRRGLLAHDALVVVEHDRRLRHTGRERWSFSGTGNNQGSSSCKRTWMTSTRTDIWTWPNISLSSEMKTRSAAAGCWMCVAHPRTSVGSVAGIMKWGSGRRRFGYHYQGHAGEGSENCIGKTMKNLLKICAVASKYAQKKLRYFREKSSESPSSQIANAQHERLDDSIKRP